MSGNVVSLNREIIFKRVFGASREVVWNAWTQPEVVIKWIGTEKSRKLIQEYELKPNGICRLVVYGIDENEYQNKITIKTIKNEQELSFIYNSDPKFAINLTATLNFAVLGYQTEVILRILFNTTEERDNAIMEYNIVQTINESLDRLNKLLSDKYLNLFNKQ